jgi:hypothetical protein
MEARELVELAALVAAHGPAILALDESPAVTHVEQYWVASRCRLNRWCHTLRKYQREVETIGPAWAADQWHTILPTLEEVLTSEILTRVWGAVVSAADRRHNRKDSDLVVRSVLIGHSEARHRVLTTILHAPSEINATHPINRLRQRCERWTDVLVGYLLAVEDVGEFAFSLERAKDFADSLEHHRRQGHGRQSWNLTLGSLRAAFRTSIAERTASPDLNAHIAQSVAGSLPPNLFDGTGLARSIWLARMDSVASDIQGFVADLLSPHAPHEASPLHPRW